MHGRVVEYYTHNQNVKVTAHKIKASNSCVIKPTQPPTLTVINTEYRLQDKGRHHMVDLQFWKGNLAVCPIKVSNRLAGMISSRFPGDT